MRAERAATPPDVEPPPPFLGSWRRVYGLVLGELVVLIAVFWLLSRWAS